MSAAATAGGTRPQIRRRVRTPTLLQGDALECGAVSLGIVLAHHGRWIAPVELARACGVSRDGASAGGILRAARGYGLRAEGFRAEPAALRRLPFPVILHWEFNHFLVLEGFGRGGRVRINDPATGPRAITEEELDRGMTGVVLAFEPGPDFRRGGSPPRPLRSLARRAAGGGAALGAVLAAGLSLLVVEAAAPAFPRVMVDHVLTGRRPEWLLPLLGAMAAAAVVAGALVWLQGNALLRLETRLAVRGSRDFLWHLLRLPTSFFDRSYTGAISERVPINDRISRFLHRDVGVQAVAGVLALFLLTLMARYSLLLTGAGVAVLAVNAAALRWVARRRADAGHRLLQEEMKLNGTALLGLRTIETLKATAGEGELFARWSGYRARLLNARQRLTRSTHLLEALPPFLAAVNGALILGVGGAMVIGGSMTLGTLVAFQLLMASFLAPVTRLVGLGGRLQTAGVDVRRLDDVLAHAPELPGDAGLPDPAAEDPAPRRLTGELELREATFGYHLHAPPLLDRLSIHLTPGRRVALVGATGSGKSTVARLAAGLHAPWSGRVLLDGVPRDALPRAVVVRSVAVVDQEIFLFAGTVRENLTLWDPAVPDERLEAAARDACIHDEILARPGGYDARVEERGANWSGGERQRLELARALALDPALLILDEATGALDPRTEARIDRNLRRRGCACLIVAHRLSAVRDADEILVLEGGRVVQRGTHDALARVDGPYRALLAAG